MYVGNTRVYIGCHWVPNDPFQISYPYLSLWHLYIYCGLIDAQHPFSNFYEYLCWWHLCISWQSLGPIIFFKFPTHLYVHDTFTFLLVANWMPEVIFRISYLYLYYDTCLYVDDLWISTLHFQISYPCLYWWCVAIHIYVGDTCIFIHNYVVDTYVAISDLVGCQHSSSNFLFVSMLVTLVHLFGLESTLDIF